MLDESGPRTRAIEDWDVGMRAAGRNPLREEVGEYAPGPDPETSRKLVLRMTKESGRALRINLLRSVVWIESVGAVEGGKFHLDLPEMGAIGDAHVEAVLPCPPIHPGAGNVVTGTFAHEADPETRILSVAFSDGAYLKGVTDNHPFWSVEANDFVAIGELREGDRVMAGDRDVSIARVDSRFAQPGEMLYNLETHNEHVYQVSVSGILVHNSCVVPKKLTQAQSDVYRRSARRIWEQRTSARASLSGLDVHHRIPLEWAHKLPNADPNRAANLIGVGKGVDHESLNNIWKEFSRSLNGRDPSAAEIMKKVLDIDTQFGHLFQFLP